MSIGAHIRAVRQYYDTNTRLFNMFGKNGGTRNIHASIYGPGVRTPEEASHFSNGLILREVQALGLAEPNVLDLGCGVGASLAYLSRHAAPPCHLTGITLSRKQAHLARKHLDASGYPEADIHCGDFHDLPATWTAKFDLAFALEAFAHSPTPEEFFSQASRVIRPGGRLLLIDTFPLEDIPGPGHAGLSDYQNHWKAGHLLTPRQLASMSGDHGLPVLQETDLTCLLDTGRPRDRVIGWVNRHFRSFGRRHPYLQSLRGGGAVQAGLTEGWLGYRLILCQRETS